MKKKILWQQIKSYKWGSVYIKYLGQLFVLLAVPIVIMVISIFSFFENSLETEISNVNTVSLIRISNSIDMTIQNIYNQTNWLAEDNNVLYFMNSTDTANFEYDPQRIVNMLKGVIQTASSFIDSVHIYSLDSGDVISLQGGGKLENFYDNKWYDEYLENREKFFWFQSREMPGRTKANKRVITVFNDVKNISGHKGVIIVNIDVDALSEFMATNSSNIENVAFYDRDGHLLYPFDDTDGNFETIKAVKANSPYSVITSDNNIKKVTTYLKSDKTDWTYTSSLKLTGYSNKMTNLRNIMYITIGTSVLICILLAVYVFYLMIKPVNKILFAIDENNRQEFPKGLNEIDFIINTISKTQLDKQKQEIELDNRLKLLKKAQITAMQAQINPHFLLNILNTIRFMAMKLTKGSNDVAEAITSLLGLYKINLTDSEHFTTVAAEIEHVTRYIELQKIRFKDKFDVEFDIEPSAINLSSMKLMLQPIVENAISHGIRPKKGNGTIKICVYISGGKLIFEVSDDGVGMSSDKIKMLNEYMKSDYFESFEHIGVKNVNQRLKLIFGDEYGILVWSKENIGTKITITLPVIER